MLKTIISNRPTCGNIKTTHSSERTGCEQDFPHLFRYSAQSAFRTFFSLDTIQQVSMLEFLMVVSAPFCIRMDTMSLFWQAAAACRAVDPEKFWWLMLAPFLRRSSTTSAWPDSAAWYSAVRPDFPSGLLTSASKRRRHEIKGVVALVLCTARCRAVKPIKKPQNSGWYNNIVLTITQGGVHGFPKRDAENFRSPKNQ